MNINKSNEISISEITDVVKGWIKYLVTQWHIILIVGIMAAAAGFYYAYTSKKKYTARLTFALEEKSSGLGSYAAIASQFGVDLGGSGGSGAFTGDNLLELMKSRLIIEHTLLTPVTIDNKTDLLVNRYIAFEGLDVKWTKREDTKDIKYSIGKPRKSFTLKEDSVLFKIGNILLLQSIKIKRVDKRLNMVYVDCISEDEQFAKYFTEALVANASTFYIETKTKKSKSTIHILENKIDSVKKLLDSKLYSTAHSQDQNLNVVKAKVKVPYAQDQIDIQLLTAVYAELSKNLELASFSLMREEPLVQVIDTPIFPLPYEKRGKLFSMLLFSVIAELILLTVLIIRRNIKIKQKKLVNYE